MKKIVVHWTGGTRQPNFTDFEHYHYLVNDTGEILKGNYTPENNQNCANGKYARHCGGGNTRSIGIAMCGMFVPNGTPIKKTKFPLTKIQCEATFKLIAELAQKYSIKITPKTVLTHYEFGQANPKTSSHGKIDIIWLPPFPFLATDDVGKFIRNKARWYLSNLQ